MLESGSWQSGSLHDTMRGRYHPLVPHGMVDLTINQVRWSARSDIDLARIVSGVVRSHRGRALEVDHLQHSACMNARSVTYPNAQSSTSHASQITSLRAVNPLHTLKQLLAVLLKLQHTLRSSKTADTMSLTQAIGELANVSTSRSSHGTAVPEANAAQSAIPCLRVWNSLLVLPAWHGKSDRPSNSMWLVQTTGRWHPNTQWYRPPVFKLPSIQTLTPTRPRTLHNPHRRLLPSCSRRNPTRSRRCCHSAIAIYRFHVGKRCTTQVEEALCPSDCGYHDLTPYRDWCRRLSALESAKSQHRGYGDWRLG